MVSVCEKYGKIAQTTGSSRFQLDFVAIPLRISLISCCYTLIYPLAHSQGLCFPLYLHPFTLLYAELLQRSQYAATETWRCY